MRAQARLFLRPTALLTPTKPSLTDEPAIAPIVGRFGAITQLMKKCVPGDMGVMYKIPNPEFRIPKFVSKPSRLCVFVVQNLSSSAA
jgi:hypothetical protein